MLSVGNWIRNSCLDSALTTLLDQPRSISQLKQIHALLITSGLSHQPPFHSKLFSLLPSSCHADYTHRLLLHCPNPSVIDWNTVIRAYSGSRSPNKSIRFFVEMLRFGLCPDHFTYPFLVKASARLSSIEHGMSVHSWVIRTGHQLDLFIQNSLIHMYGSCGEILYARKVFDEMPHRTMVSWNSMLDGYAKCRDLKSARKVFESMPEKDVVSWSSLIDGYVKGGEYREAIAVFERMKFAGWPKANEVTMVSVLCACAHLGALELGRSMHCYMVENELPLTIALLTSLVDMYAKCGAIEEAMVAFKSIPKDKTDVLLWNTMIGGLANHGHVQDSLELYAEMQIAGVAPDEITYLSLLSSCAHRGLVKEAWRFFESLERNGMTPKTEHYACMVDVLSRAGQFREAYDFLNRMPVEPTPAMLGALLSGCMNHGKLELAVTVGKRLIEVDPHHDGRYVGLSNAYAAVKRWEEAKTMRQAMEKSGVKKCPGFSCVEISGSLDLFIARDKTHAKAVEIYAMVNLTLMQIKMVLHPDEQEIFL
uniref:Uncharacterized protein n=1 Tax=Opuntia streptacantha TaxID=393608 RepID=A0A7C9EUJ9_OPUST